MKRGSEVIGGIEDGNIHCICECVCDRNLLSEYYSPPWLIESWWSECYLIAESETQCRYLIAIMFMPVFGISNLFLGIFCIINRVHWTTK